MVKNFLVFVSSLASLLISTIIIIIVIIIIIIISIYTLSDRGNSSNLIG